MQKCYEITNNAIKCLASSIKSSEITENTSILSSSRDTGNGRVCKDSLECCTNAPQTALNVQCCMFTEQVKFSRSNYSISNILGGIFDENKLKSTYIKTTQTLCW